MSKHTPGPWSVDYRTVKNAKGESICSAGNNRKVWGDELDASLRLIAASPALLEAAEYARDILDRGRGKQATLRAIERLDAAIAAATGEPKP